MKKIIQVIVLFICVLSGCSEEQNQVLDDDILIKVLVDMHIAEAAMISVNKKTKDSLSKVYYEQIFTIHEVTDSVFYQDLEMLGKDPNKIEALYQQVMDEVEKLDMEQMKKEAGKKEVKDSTEVVPSTKKEVKPSK